MANNANEFINRSFDRQHNRIDYPQREYYGYRDSDPLKSSSPGISQQRTGPTYVSKAGTDAGNRSSFQMYSFELGKGGQGTIRVLNRQVISTVIIKIVNTGTSTRVVPRQKQSR